MKIILLLLALVNVSVSLASESDESITYLGSYTHNRAPAFIIQFSGLAPNRNSVTISETKTKKALPNNWILNKSKTALIYTDIEVGKSYTITLNKPLSYKKSTQHDVIVYEKEPSVDIVGRGPIVPIFGKRTLPISTINVKQVSVEVLKVTDPALLLNSTHYSESPSRWKLRELTKATTPVTHLNFDIVKTEKNTSQYTELLLPKSLESGWYLLAIKPTGNFDYNSEKVLHVALTDIGIQAKVFPHSLTVQLASLSSSEPIQQASVSIYHKNGKQTQLGHVEQHIGTFNYNVKQGDILSVKKGEQISYLPLRELPLDLSDYAVSGREYQDVDVFTYSNRDLFKPGEILPLNLLLRNSDGQLVQDVNRLFIEYIKPDQTVARSRWLQQQDAKGYYQDTYQIPANAPMGKWIAQVKLHKDANKPIGQFSFNVNEFVPERMDLTVDLTKKITPNAQHTSVNLHGKYLFGAPASKNTVKVRSHYQPTHYFDTDFRDFYVGESFSISAWNDVPSVNDIKLDEKGEHVLSLPLLSPSLMKSPVNARFTFELQETGGATVSRSQQRQLWSDKAIAGIKAPSDKIDSYSDVLFEFALLNASGDALIAGEMDYTLERNMGGYYWIYNENSGWSIRGDDEWRPVSSEKITTRAGKTTPLSLNVEWGRYRITLLTKDGVRTRLPFRAGWSDDATIHPVKPDQLSITLDKKHYRIGDTVAVTIFSKQAGTLQLNLDANKTLQSQNHQVIAGENTFTMTLDEEANRHDLYLTATLVSTPDASQNPANAPLPQRFFAIAPVLLDRSDRILPITIEHSDKFLPLQTANITVKLNKPTTEPTWVTVSLVDRGIINLSNYHIPQIAPWFFDHKRYQGDVIDLYSHFYQTRPDSFMTAHRYGGDQEMSLNINNDELVESKTIAMMSKLVQFDSSGEATISFDLPDYNGQAQVVAMAFNGDQFGQAESNVTIATPIVAELSVPRFLSPTDTSQTYVEVFNTSELKQEISAKVTVDDQLTLTGEHSFNIDLKDGERHGQSVVFDINPILGSTASTTIALHISSKDEKGKTFEQTREWTIPVRSSQPVISQRELITLSTETDDAKAHEYQLINALWRSYLPSNNPMALVSYSLTPQLNISDYAEGLFSYPYGCAEQTTSRGMPWLLNDSTLTPFKNNARDLLTDREIVEESIAHLSTMQKANGSFSLWNKFGRSDTWLSMYVTEYLIMANQAFPESVPSQMLTLIKDNLRNTIGKQNTISSSHFYALWLGAKQGIVNNSNLYSADKIINANTSHYVSPLSYAHIGGAYLLNGRKISGEHYLNKVLASSPISRRNHDEYEYGSQLRDIALTISILNDVERVIKLSNDMVMLRNRLAITAMELANKKSYLSTQERIALIRAGIALRQHALDLVELSINDHDQVTQIREQGMNQKQLKAGTIITNMGDLPVFLQVATSGLIKEDAVASTLAYEKASRTYRFENGKPYRGEPLKIGDKLIVSVHYKLEQHVPLALIVEYLPTGFVLENPEYTNSNQIINAAKLEKASDWSMLEYRNDRLIASASLRKDHQYVINYVLRAETPGISNIPAIFIEEMYQPQNMIYKPYSGFKQFEIIQ
ncbi:alpha-2-macroglobulin [Vibrio crassostreae]|nr:alpha-2-macroglobulin [Vibrio crassostreae]